jgi:Zinc knuckle
VLNVLTPGSAYFPFNCNWCGKVSHKAQNCLDHLAGKLKTKKNGRGGGKSNAKSSNQGQFSSGNKQKKDLSHIKCYNCGEMGHYKNKCPKLKKESANNIKVVLMVKWAKINESDDFEFVASTTKWEYLIKTDSLYCKTCKDSEDSVHNQSSESLSMKVQSDMKNESPKQALLISKCSKYELMDDFFDEFSNDGSDDSEEYDSEDNSGVVPTPLWWFDACKEISLSSMEECELISSNLAARNLQMMKIDLTMAMATLRTKVAMVKMKMVMIWPAQLITKHLCKSHCGISHWILIICHGIMMKMVRVEAMITTTMEMGGTMLMIVMIMAMITMVLQIMAMVQVKEKKVMTMKQATVAMNP